VLSVFAWVAAFFVAQWLAPDAAVWLPMGKAAQPLRYAAGFAVVFIAVVFSGALVAWLLKKLMASVGLGLVDRALGAIFGLGPGPYRTFLLPVLLPHYALLAVAAVAMQVDVNNRYLAYFILIALYLVAGTARGFGFDHPMLVYGTTIPLAALATAAGMLAIDVLP